MKGLRIAVVMAVLWTATSRGAEEEHKEKKEPAPVRVENGKVFVSSDAQKRNGFQLAEVTPAEMARQIEAFGVIQDPTPLLLLETEMKDATAAALIAGNQLQRAKTLFQDEQTVSRKTLEMAENQLRVENARREVARRRMALEWGNFFVQSSGTNQEALIERLLSQKSVLGRVTLPMGQHLAMTNFSIRLRIPGSEQWIDGLYLGVAPQVDPRLPGESFLLRVDEPPAGLRPGAMIEARILDQRSVEKGWRLPAEAIIRYSGQHWIYVKEDAEHFEKKQVSLDNRDEKSWFTKTRFEPGTFCVVTGAASLLSAELQAAFGGDPE
jgi:multidrug efflux pump subunit AcrA (membrane-fusion protein)